MIAGFVTEKGRKLPCVVEPSFGIGRLVYALLENTFCLRDLKPEEGKEGGGPSDLF